jgi:GH24 family phage-related lysozyme (muramidase)
MRRQEGGELRIDGTKKSMRGYLGPIENSRGQIMTELSIGVEMDGKEILIPTLVPTLNDQDIQVLQNLSDDAPIPESIIKKAVVHAQERMKENKDAFYQDGEEEERANFDEGGLSKAIRENFYRRQRQWESNHGYTPIRTHDAREKDTPENERSFDVGYGHKITDDEEKSGKIYDIQFKDSEGNYITLTEDQIRKIQQKDVEANVTLARDSGWDAKLAERDLSWDTLDEGYKLALGDLAYNVGGSKAGKTWTAIFNSIQDNDIKGFVNNLRRQDAGKYTPGMDNRAAKAAYAAGLITSRQEAIEYGLTLANTNEIPFKSTN